MHIKNVRKSIGCFSVADCVLGLRHEQRIDPRFLLGFKFLEFAELLDFAQITLGENIGRRLVISQVNRVFT